VWDAGTGKTIAGPFKGHTHVVNSVVFSYPNGSHIISGSEDCTIRVWDAHSDDTIAVPEDFTVEGDGWITNNSNLLFWVSPDFHPYLPHPRNTLVIGPEGTAFIDYHCLKIGKSWSECYEAS
jgi:WD40 repeat protein